MRLSESKTTLLVMLSAMLLNFYMACPGELRKISKFFWNLLLREAFPGLVIKTYRTNMG